MTLKEIYTALANRMVGAIMIHSQLVQIFAFVDLLPDMRKQESQLQEETHDYSELNKYYIQHHHNILIADNPPQIDILNLGLLKKSSDELSTEDKMYLIKYGMKEWIEWERKSKVIYEDSYRELLDISEVASADFVSRFVRDVDLELKEAEKIFRVREGIDWDLSAIYDKQARVNKR
jgi:hypothetical protein